MSQIEDTANKVVKLFDDISRTITDSSRIKKEQELSTLLHSGHLLDIVEHIFNHPFQLTTKRLLAGLSQRSFKEIIKENEISLESRSNCIQRIIVQLANRNIDLDTKESLSLSIRPFLIDGLSYLNENLLRAEVCKKVYELGNQEEKDDIIGLLIGLKEIMSSITTHNSWEQFFQTGIEGLFQFIEGFFARSVDEVRSATERKKLNTKEVYLATVILKLLSDILLTLVDGIRRNKNYKEMNLILANQSFRSIFGTLLTLNVTNENDIIVICNVEEINETLSQMKSGISRFYRRLAEEEFEETNQLNAEQTQGYQEIIMMYIKSIVKFSNSTNDPAGFLERNPQVSELVSSMVDTISLGLDRPEFYDLVREVSLHLLTKSLLPLATITENSILETIENPERFIEVSMDTCHIQEGKELRTRVFALIERLCEKVDGMLTIVFALILELIEFKFVNKNSDHVDGFPSDIDSPLHMLKGTDLEKVSSEKLLELGLMLSSTISYLIATRGDLSVDLLNILKNHFTQFTVTESPLIQSRILILLSFYFEILIQKGTENSFGSTAEGYLRYVCHCIELEDDTDEILVQAGVKCLAFLLEVPSTRNMLLEFQVKILKNVKDAIPHIKTTHFFDLLYNIFKSKFSDGIITNPELFEDFLNKLVQRVIKELNTPTYPQNPDILINLIFNILRYISENPAYIPRFIHTVDTAMGPLISILKNAKTKVCLDEDLISMFNALIQTTSGVPKNFLELAAFFPQIVAIYEDRVSLVLTAYNFMMAKMPAIFQRFPQYVNDVVGICVRGIILKSTSLGDLDAAEAALLMQYTIMYLHRFLTPEHWLVMLNSVTAIVNEDKGENFFLARVYGVYLVGFIYRPEVVMEYLDGHGIIWPVLNTLTERSAYFSTNYDRKVLILGLISLSNLKTSNGELDEANVKFVEFASINILMQLQAQFYSKLNSKNILYESERRSTEFIKGIQQKLKSLAKLDNTGQDLSSQSFITGMTNENNDLIDLDSETIRLLSQENLKETISFANCCNLIEPADEFEQFNACIEALKIKFGSDKISQAFSSIDQDSSQAIKMAMEGRRVKTQCKVLKNGEKIEKSELRARRIIKRKKTK